MSATIGRRRPILMHCLSARPKRPKSKPTRRRQRRTDGCACVRRLSVPFTKSCGRHRRARLGIGALPWYEVLRKVYASEGRMAMKAEAICWPLLLAILMLPLGSATAADKLKVVTSVAPITDIVRHVGGDAIE